MISEEDRARYAAQIAALDKREAELRYSRDPYLEVVRALAELRVERETIIDRIGAEVVGWCEACQRMLLVGDQGYSYEDGPMFCAAHAPTYADHKSQLDECPESFEDYPEAAAEIRRRAEQGGLDDKILHTL